ncbi:MAG: PDC sensor domain-containing protein [Candidatus Thiodiazotropha sp.]
MRKQINWHASCSPSLGTSNKGKQTSMAAMSYLANIERYHEHRQAIRELLASILTGVINDQLFTDPAALQLAISEMGELYPFAEQLYTLDSRGVQSSDIMLHDRHDRQAPARVKGRDRSQRPYYLLAKEHDGVVVTEPYLSIDSRNLCLSAALKWLDSEGRLLGYLVLDIDLAETIEFLMGDTGRRRFVPVFRMVYSTIVVGLFTVVAVLLFGAFHEVYLLTTNHTTEFHLKPFGIVIFLTLGLAIFDLGKTVLEEEVLTHKDIFRHSSTRRTITRFIAAILIAVSIEALLLMFKAVLGDGEHLMAAVFMMLTAVALLIGLGIYVFLGARAEAILLQHRGMTSPISHGRNG